MNAEPLYTIAQLNALIASAAKLGFWDDVQHFTAMRKELLAKEASR